MRSADELAASDFAWCREVLRCGSKSFSAAGRLLPGPMRDAFAAVYAFCRGADDAIDLGAADEAALQALRDRLTSIMAGGDIRDPGDRALSRVVARYELPRTVFDALLEGFAWELEGRRYETLAELRAYAARVASCVGAAATLIMGRRDPETLSRACDLGIAMQFTNIARDVGEDARAGRLYLPLDWMEEEGLDPEAFLAAPRFSPAVGRAVRRVLEAADTLYARADAGIARLPESCRPAIHAARLIYADIGRAIARNGYDSVSQRAVTTPSRKAWLLLRAVARPAPLDGVTASFPPLSEVRFLVESAAAGGMPVARHWPRRRALRLLGAVEGA